MSSPEENTKEIQALLEGNGAIMSRDQISETLVFLVKWIDGITGEAGQATVPECELRASCSTQLDQYLLSEGKA
ncbi:Uncharacterized protein HZ326_9470 [Fusarium oxysporum f. sp. albedinis]|nr:Uncharacterized protein HZ326_9470 [Fusarium oxysporum f. sp. albedinis]